MSTATGDLRILAADWGVGGLVNAIDNVSKQHGQAEVPPAATRAADALLALLHDLGIDRPDVRGAAAIWRVRP